MKYLIVSLFLAVSGFIHAQENVYVEFTNQTTFDELVKIKTQLAEKQILLNYLLIEFDSSKKLKSLSIEVDCQDGFSGTGKSSRLLNNDKITIKRDYSYGAKVPFEITVGQ